MKAYRDMARARRAGLARPEVIVARTVHPVFEQAAQYLNVVAVRVGCTEDGRMDAAEVRRAVTRNTILVVASAPQTSHGVIDPIEVREDGGLCRVWVTESDRRALDEFSF